MLSVDYKFVAHEQENTIAISLHLIETLLQNTLLVTWKMPTQIIQLTCVQKHHDQASNSGEILCSTLDFSQPPNRHFCGVLYTQGVEKYICSECEDIPELKTFRWSSQSTPGKVFLYFSLLAPQQGALMDLVATYPMISVHAYYGVTNTIQGEQVLRLNYKDDGTNTLSVTLPSLPTCMHDFYTLFITWNNDTPKEVCSTYSRVVGSEICPPKLLFSLPLPGSTFTHLYQGFFPHFELYTYASGATMLFTKKHPEHNRGFGFLLPRLDTWQEDALTCSIEFWKFHRDEDTDLLSLYKSKFTPDADLKGLSIFVKARLCTIPLYAYTIKNVDDPYMHYSFHKDPFGKNIISVYPPESLQAPVALIMLTWDESYDDVTILSTTVVASHINPSMDTTPTHRLNLHKRPTVSTTESSAKRATLTAD